MNKKILFANWKMNPLTMVEAVSLAKTEDLDGVVICAPSVFLVGLKNVLKKADLGAQDIFWGETGPFTGNISSSQLKKIGVNYVIVGHSERRILGEANDVIARKVAAAVETGIVPVLCVGETAQERGAGRSEAVIGRQLELNLALVKKTKTAKIIVTYEPVWAISTQKNAKPDTPENAHAMIHLISGLVKKRFPKAEFLYGGSVNIDNVREFLQFPEVTGALVGGASLRAEEFVKMVKLIK